MLIILLASLSGGIFIVSCERLPSLFISELMMVAGAFLGIAFSLIHRRGFVLQRFHLWSRLSLFMIVFSISAGWFAYCGNLQQRVVLNNGEWQLEVVDSKRSQYGSTTYKAKLNCQYLSTEAGKEACQPIAVHPLALPAYIQITQPKSSPLGIPFKGIPGELLRATLTFKDENFAGNPGFDRARWAFSERLIGAARVDGGYLRLAHRKTIHYWRYWLSKRLAYVSHMESSSYSELPLYPVVQALTLGDRQWMTDAHWRLLRETGTTHLMAISGLHMGLLSGWVYWFVCIVVGSIRALNHRYYPQSIAAVMAISTAGIYGLMAGFSLPTQRAFIMLLFGCLGAISGRPKVILGALATALLVILFLQPFAILTASLWLSFGAVLIVFYVMANRLEPLRESTHFVRKFVLVLKMQGSIFVCMAPLSFYFFGGASINGILSNLVAIPLVTGLLLPACFINALVAVATPAWVPFLGEINLWLLDVLMCCLQWLNAHLPDYHERVIDLFELSLLVVGGLLLCAPLDRFFKAIGAVVFLAILAVPPNVDRNSVTLFNHRGMFALFNVSEKGPLLLDETPGLSRREISMLGSQLPAFKRKWGSMTDWHATWFRQHRYFDLLSAYTESRSIDCKAERASIEGQAQGCILNFNWQGYEWLIVGGITSAQQQDFITEKVVAIDRKIDFLLLSGDAFSGAFLNQFEGATVLLWGHQSIESEMKERFHARKMRLVELATQGAQTINFTNTTFTLEPVLKKRFYHP